jgi:hypothetical protein
MIKKIQTKDISTEMVLDAYRTYDKWKGQYPYDIIMEKTGCCFKVAYGAMDREDDKGLINYGVSLRTGWIEAENV